MKIEGILARDNSGWQEEFAEGVKENGCGVMWKHQFSFLEEVLPQLRELIKNNGSFYYYNVAKNFTNYRMRIIDVATNDTYDLVKKSWKAKDPYWYSDAFDHYVDVKKNQKAIVAFLVDEVAEIRTEDAILISNFTTYKGKKTSIQNAVAYTKIMTKNEINMKQIADTLTANHNLILTGAPGTGKTYLAKQIAQQMIFGEVIEKMNPDEEKRFNEQCGFVQFHPSYDYTDFVEGLRPKQDDNGNIGFERKDGVFKDFCARAIAKKTNEESIFDEVWDKLISDIRINLSTGKLTKIGGWEYGLSTKDSLKYSSINTPSQYSFTITKKNIWDTYCGRQARPSGAFQKDMLDIVRYLKQTYDLPDKPKLTENDDKTTKPFVFIIDEINRGEISKILGELFFSIDPGYRGTDGKVRTQYANMQTEPNEFDSALKITDVNNCGHFFVPENVYIIGTMNDIDRSVESMDFAFRRRFAFKEIKAEDTRNMLDKEEAWKDENGKIVSPSTETITIIKNRMNNLNNAIWDKKTKSGIEGLSSAYHIGASYFLKLVNYRNDKGEYVDQSFTDLWNNHLDGLLREYMRGMQNVDEKMEKLKAAYDNESDSNN